MVAIARFARTLGTLLAPGVPLLAACKIVRNVVSNEVLAETIDAALAVSEGRALRRCSSVAVSSRRSCII